MVNTSTKWTRDASHKDGLPGVQRLRSIHHKITVVQVPGADLDLSHTHAPTQVLAAQAVYSWLLIKVTLKDTSARGCEFIKTLCGSVYLCPCVSVCVRSHWPACLWWWGWIRKGRACCPPRCRRRSKPARSSRPGTAGRRSLYKRGVIIDAAVYQPGGFTLEFSANKFLNGSSDRKEGRSFQIWLRDETEKWKWNNFETNLWGGNRICSLLCEASLQTGAQNAENWLLSHLKYSIWKSA